MYEEISRWLNERGRGPSGLPLFRIVFSDYQTEVRSGTFEECCGNIYLRTVTGIRTVKKYPYIKGRWILERWYPPEQVYTPEIPSTREGSYEPLYVFEDANGNPLPLTIKVVEFIVSFILHTEKLRPEQIESNVNTGEQIQEEKQYQIDSDSLEISPVLNALHLKEGIGYGS